MSGRFGNGSNSNGQFWYGSTTNFPGFLYKKNVGVGGRRTTKFAAGGNITCNKSTYLYNKYKPGTGGVGASSIANRRAKNRLASVCGSNNKCFPCYNTLGQYSSYTHNPNGFVPCPIIQSYSINTQPTVPSAPTLISLTATDENLILNFIIGSNGGSPITDIEYSIDSGITWTSSGQISSPFAITGLTNGISYQVGIRSKNIYGTSSPSNFILGTPNPYVETYLNIETTSWSAPPGVTSVEYLVVGGGGGSGGGFDTGGGGGGGGGMVLSGTLSVTPGSTYTVIVGDGGDGGVSIRSPVSETNGAPGQNSIFASITSLGGGGGYASRYTSGVASSGGLMVSGLIASTGGSGGGSSGDGNGAGGGGGGNTSNGNNGITNTGGNGGDGILNSISGSIQTYGSGGRGANGNVTTGNAGVAGAPNTGNGARGGGTSSSAQTNGAKGGSGIVIIKF
jgi:hypothetical protein